MGNHTLDLEKTMYKKLGLSLIFLFAFISSSYGTDNLFRNLLDTREKRMLLIVELEKSFKSLDLLVPDLTPREKQWLNKELSDILRIKDKEIKNRRLSNFLDSEVKIRESANQFISNNLQWIQCIKQAESLKKNIHCWAGLSHELTDDQSQSNLQTILRNLKIDVTKLDSSSIPIPPQMSKISADRIFDMIVYPYLSSQKKTKPSRLKK